MDTINDQAVTQLRGIAVQVAVEASELVRDMRAEVVGGSTVTSKSSETDVVTAADHAAEKLIRSRLAELRPSDSVLGEEQGGPSDAAEVPSSGRDGFQWVVDPIDGTVNYLYGFPFYAVSIAVQLDGESLAGAVVEPVSGRVWSAAKGHGAELDGSPLRVSNADRLDLSLLGTGFGYSVQRRQAQASVIGALLGSVRDIRRGGAASLDLCAVAAGWLDAYVEHGLSRWDWAAGALIAAEAGAVVRLPRDTDTDGLGAEAILCCTPEIERELRTALVEAGAGEI